MACLLLNLKKMSRLRNVLTGWWLTYPSEKYESQMGLLFSIYGKNNPNVPNHQPGVGVLRSIPLSIFVHQFEVELWKFCTCPWICSIPASQFVGA